MKNNISYYRHLTNAHHHWKFKTLRRKYKWEGEGKFWALNNIIAEAENCRLNVTDEDMKASIAADLDFDVEDFETYLAFLIDKCKLIKKDEDGLLFTDITQEVLDEVSVKREAERQRKLNYRNGKNKNVPPENGNVPRDKANVPPENEESGAEKQQSKVKESKVYVVIDGANKFLDWLSEMFDVDVGLKYLWNCKGFDPKKFLNGVELWSARNHGKKYNSLSDARDHFQNWMPHYHKAASEIKTETNANASNTNNTGRKLSKHEAGLAGSIEDLENYLNNG